MTGVSCCCSDLELERESTTGEVGMERDERPGSSAKDGGASVSLDGRLRASLDKGGGASVLEEAWLADSGGRAESGEGCVRRPKEWPSCGMRSESEVGGCLATLCACGDGGANELGPGVGGGVMSAGKASMSRKDAIAQGLELERGRTEGWHGGLKCVAMD
ncbi:hypothetical protein L1887_47172 [Cichorium endivia]|nr:hypothetical protein L1887_47172 [Cichorium endivia]